ncbi:MULTISPECIES: hypothetical protein [unclassified Rhizobium]|uniref:hypothetical protein n=1 Tax=unclassified Rhizobium TaxID=2613769 RepID=UPI000EA8DCA5|nr:MULTISPECIES: hypothetical protein [unclassified Rhizobium]AYG68802.1 hypothetical protein CCGE531_22220 [Rhizobium sp. CCGE531]AYG75188.1 hypothetical protein CCGE532_21695 [Rhizobium sp. CCGE532]
MKKLLIASLAAMIALSGTAFAQTAADMNKNLDGLFGEHQAYADFFTKLKSAIGSADKATVAGLVSYPFSARINGKAVKIKDAKHFTTDYDQVITAKVKDAVAKQKYETLFANAQGVMIGDGEIWFAKAGKDVKHMTMQITAVND